LAGTVSAVENQGVPDEKHMRLRYEGTCRICGRVLPARAEAVYERSSKTVRCLAHHTAEVDPGPGPGDIVSGTPGESARREFERRRSAREQRVRGKHPKIGGLVLALTDEPQSTRAWDTGAIGEERLGRRLNELSSDVCRVLHDRRIPGTRANIDHLVVTRSGVFVVDAKRYKGRPQLKVDGGLFRPRVEKLLVGSRDCTKVVDGVLKQVETVRAIVGGDVPVHGVLCFVEADWPLIGGAFTTRGVEVLWPKRLYPRLGAEGPLGTAALRDTHRALAAALPQA
jgi:Nuclease-related domain